MTTICSRLVRTIGAPLDAFCRGVMLVGPVGAIGAPLDGFCRRMMLVVAVGSASLLNACGGGGADSDSSAPQSTASVRSAGSGSSSASASFNASTPASTADATSASPQSSTSSASRVSRLAVQSPNATGAFTANGWFWNPNEGGTGFMFEAQGNLGFVGFFMYEDGTGKPIWYAARGPFVANGDGTFSFTGDMRLYSNGQAVSATSYREPSSVSVGPVSITFTGQDAVAQLPGGRRWTATRFDFNGLATTSAQPHQPELGWFWNPLEGGRGYAIEVQNNQLFMAIPHYNPDGTPTWNVVQGDIRSGVTTLPFDMYVGGQSLTSTYRNGIKFQSGSYTTSFRNPCAGQVQLAGTPAVSIRRFVFGTLPAGSECHATTQAIGDRVPGVQAGPVRMLPGDSVFGRIDSTGDVDAYGITLQGGVAYHFDLKGASGGEGTLADPLLSLYDAGLRLVATNNDLAAGRPDSRITFTPSLTGTYYLAAQGVGLIGGGIGSYVLTASGLAPGLTPTQVLPASSFAGELSATLTGRFSGTANLVIDSQGRVTGSLQMVRGGRAVTLVGNGSVDVGGPIIFYAPGAEMAIAFRGILGNDRQVVGTWWDDDGHGGTLFGQGTAGGAVARSLVVRARGSMAAGVGPTMVVRVGGSVVGTVEVRSTEFVDYSFPAPGLTAGSRVDVVYTNDGGGNGEDRNLFVQYVSDGSRSVLPTAPDAIVDKGSNERAFDGLDVIPGQGELYWNAALRLIWVGPATVDPNLARKLEASRLLQQATFGPTPAEIDRLVGTTDAAWLAEQLALPASPDFVNTVQAQYDRGAAWRPGGGSYSPAVVAQKFWATAATSPGQLRKRMAFALHHIMMVSQADSNLYNHSRAYANYLDILNKHAFGNFRNLIEDLALSPVMGIYLSHIRNRKEDPAAGRNPDENFARELMQLFTIGLHELNPDGSQKLDGNGQPIETYNNADVMAMAKVFTGWSWGFPDAELTDNKFRSGNPDYSVTGDNRSDLQRMKAYPGQHSTAAKPLFAGKSFAVTIPANTAAADSLRIALDSLFNHPNIGPFIGRQLIQRLVTSNPSPAYVARVAAAFNNNGQGVRGDLGAVVKAILLDPQARQAPGADFGKLREPVLRVGHWMRAMGATSLTGDYMMASELDSLSQRVLHAPSVFGYFRPGYVPPNSALSVTGATAPELQIVNESSTVEWVNLAESMAGSGLGWTGTARDVSVALAPQAALAAAGNVDGLIDNLDLMLFAGRMPPALRLDILRAVGGVSGRTDANHLNRARVALFVALASPDYLVQR